jgi:hypothetical protein
MEMIARKIFVALLAFLIATGAASADTYTFWIKAFIPNAHPTNPDYIVADPAGGTMIKDPIFQGKCYTTDDRGFSSDPSAGARMTSQLTLRVDGSGLTGAPADTEKTGLTQRVRCDDGSSDGCSDHASASSMTFDHISYDGFNGGTIYFSVSATASNPCFPIQIPGHVNFAPNIHYTGQFTIGVKTNVVSYNMEFGNFPAFEIYARKNEEGAVRVLAANPADRSTVIDIPGSRTLEGSVRLP